MNREVIMKDFKLNSEPTTIQLTYHFANIVTYFHPDNKHLRTGLGPDVDVTMSADEVVFWMRRMTAVDSQAQGNTVPLDYENFRWIMPVQFRITQLIQHYGKEHVRAWVNLVHGSHTGKIQEVV